MARKASTSVKKPQHLAAVEEGALHVQSAVCRNAEMQRPEQETWRAPHELQMRPLVHAREEKVQAGEDAAGSWLESIPRPFHHHHRRWCSVLTEVWTGDGWDQRDRWPQLAHEFMAGVLPAGVQLAASRRVLIQENTVLSKAGVHELKPEAPSRYMCKCPYLDTLESLNGEDTQEFRVQNPKVQVQTELWKAETPGEIASALAFSTPAERQRLELCIANMEPNYNSPKCIRSVSVLSSPRPLDPSTPPWTLAEPSSIDQPSSLTRLDGSSPASRLPSPISHPHVVTTVITHHHQPVAPHTVSGLPLAFYFPQHLKYTSASSHPWHNTHKAGVCHLPSPDFTSVTFHPAMSPILRIQPWEIDNRLASLDLVDPMGTKDTELSLIRQQTDRHGGFHARCRGPVSTPCVPACLHVCNFTAHLLSHSSHTTYGDVELGLLSRLLPVHLVLEIVLDVWVTEPHLVLNALHPRQPITIFQLTSPLPIIARRPTPFRHAECRQLRAGATLTHLAAVSLPRPLRALDSTVPNRQESPTNKIQLRLLAATLQTPIIYITMILFSTQ
ncbi:uncharacterized protein CLUP02_11310 [Colletotrichum lupini]|uniref:Uncharacterized protein n=1 Tax=Colletotrichum lupini TaxID=145971 RepID=A0A9Q8T017_9PEZI|nr:uncharacterized protein CLUP02_11310 [Colletotrichum lupini]UQC85811.1 hypothetical protein CLUP02_11310 [Colletotrichum lupini]